MLHNCKTLQVFQTQGKLSRTNLTKTLRKIMNHSIYSGDIVLMFIALFISFFYLEWFYTSHHLTNTDNILFLKKFLCAYPCGLRPEVNIRCLLYCLYSLIFEIALLCHNLYFTDWPFYLAGEFPEPVCCLHSQQLLKDTSPLDL